jgi:transcriptional regulator with XRE-family HTH domain
MVAFQEKALDDRTIGEALRDARQERGQSIEEVERATSVGKKYIAALENNDLKSLPEAVYTKKFVKALAAFYGIDPDAAAESLLKEMSAGAGTMTTRHPINFVAGRSLVSSPILFKSVAIVLVLVGILGYFAFSVRSILKPPSITLYSPHDDQVFPTSRVVLEGQTEREVDLSVNGEPVSIEADGSFKDVLNLPSGVSTLRLIAKKKHSRENVIFIKVVIDEPRMPDSASETEPTP